MKAVKRLAQQRQDELDNKKAREAEEFKKRRVVALKTANNAFQDFCGNNDVYSELANDFEADVYHSASNTLDSFFIQFNDPTEGMRDNRFAEMRLEYKDYNNPTEYKKVIMHYGGRDEVGTIHGLCHWLATEYRIL